MSVIHQRAVIYLRTQQPIAGLTHDIVDVLIQQHRAECREDAAPGDDCTDRECPHFANCPGKELQ